MIIYVKVLSVCSEAPFRWKVLVGRSLGNFIDGGSTKAPESSKHEDV